MADLPSDSDGEVEAVAAVAALLTAEAVAEAAALRASAAPLAGSGEAPAHQGGAASALPLQFPPSVPGVGAAASAAEDDSANCVVCLTEAKTHACVPCGHLCLCAGCTDLLKMDASRRSRGRGRKPACPLCRSPVDLMMHIHA